MGSPDSTRQPLQPLVEQVRDGDAEAGQLLVEALYPIVIPIVRNHLPVAIDEEDLAQEIFLKMFAKLHTFKGLQPIEHWVSRIARNTCYDHLRKQKRRGELRHADLSEEHEQILDSLLSTDADVNLHLDSPEVIRDLLNQLFTCLKPPEERVVRMLDLEQMPVKEIAAQLSWGESRVKVTAFRARKKLRAAAERLEPNLLMN